MCVQGTLVYNKFMISYVMGRKCHDFVFMSLNGLKENIGKLLFNVLNQIIVFK